MGKLKFTRDDRAFLRQIHIDPQVESSVLDDIEAARKIIMAPPQYLPNTVIISAEIAKAITAKYGELTMENFVKWKYGEQ